MKILYYNWAPFDEPRKIGGGVTVYLKNVIDYIINNTNDEVYFLSGGWKYNPFRGFPYVTKTKNIHQASERCYTYEIINSKLTAPQYTLYYNINDYIEDTSSIDIFDDFLKKHGPFDVIHINNFEGISVNVTELKKKYKKTKFIFSVHNYQPICPLVQYFQNHNRIICHDFCEGKECLKCLNAKVNYKIYKTGVKEYFLSKFSYPSSKILKSIIEGFSDIVSVMYKRHKKKYKKSNCIAANFAKYRQHNIDMLNRNTDYVISVSKKVNKIMLQHGLNPKIAKTLYIGTKIAEEQKRLSNCTDYKQLTIAFLGYARVDKGFWFLIDSLKSLPLEIAKNINIVLAVKGYNSAQKDLKNFNHVKVYDGYTHDDLKNILSDVNLGIVPVLWEDNLPQVAIEMVACGVPILCSDFGGASELCNSDMFKFQGGNKADFLNKLKYFIDNPQKLSVYWEHHSGLTTMEKHIKELYDLYKG